MQLILFNVIKKKTDIYFVFHFILIISDNHVHFYEVFDPFGYLNTTLRKLKYKI